MYIKKIYIFTQIKYTYKKKSHPFTVKVLNKVAQKFYTFLYSRTWFLHTHCTHIQVGTNVFSHDNPS